MRGALTAAMLPLSFIPLRRLAPVRCLLAVVALAGLPGAGAVVAQPPARSLVVLVDTSMSMDDLMPSVHDALGELLADLQVGERCAVFAFGDRVRPVIDAEIRDEADRAAVRARIADLQPTDRYTDVTTALDHGIRVLRRDAQERADRVHLLILLTDGRHNPPADAESPTFESLSQAFADFVPGQHWFMHYVVLRPDAAEDQVQAFVREMRGAYSLPDPEAGLGDALLRMPTPARGTLVDTAGGCSIRSAQQPGWNPAATSAAVEAGHVVETAVDGRAVVAWDAAVRIGLDVDTGVEILVAEWDPLRAAGTVRLRVARGTIEVATVSPGATWELVVETPSGTVRPLGTRFRLTVDHRDGAAAVAVRRGTVDARPVGGTTGQRCDAGFGVALRRDNTVSHPAAILKTERARSEAWDSVLNAAHSLAAQGPRLVAVNWQALGMRLGPLTPGGTWQEEARVSLAGLDPAMLRAVGAAVDHGLPPEVTATATMTRPAPVGPHIVSIHVHASEAYQPQRGQEYTTRVVLVAGAAEPLAAFPLRLWTSDQVAPTGARPNDTRRIGSGGWMIVLGFGTVGLLLLFLVYGGDRIRLGVAVGTRSVGRLLVVGNPAPGAWRADFIRLEDWLDQRGEKTVSVGRSQYCDIVLPHESVMEHHCNLVVWRGRRSSGARVVLVKNQPVAIDGARIGRGPVDLADRVQVGIGEFTLQYEDSGAKPQVLVHMRSGETVRGALHSWDMTAVSFSLAPDDPDVKMPGGPIPEVAFSDVEDIVMLSMAKSRRRRRKPADSVRVTFPRGRTLRGVLWADYRPDARLFALFPDDAPDADYVVVVRANTTGVERNGQPEA